MNIKEKIQKSLDCLIADWDVRYGKIEAIDDVQYFYTGGWSENERLIENLRNTKFWTICWDYSNSDGLHVFDISLLGGDDVKEKYNQKIIQLQYQYEEEKTQKVK